MTTPAQPPARGRQGNKFPSMRSPVTWAVILGIALAGGAYILYRRRNTAAAANASTAAPSTDTTDLAGQIATLQTEIADLQSTTTQDEGTETGTGTSTGGGGTGTGKLTAPTGFSITPHAGFADFGWSTVPGAKAYELQVAGAGGAGTGASHYDHAGAGNHAEKVKLSNGSYRARVRAGTSVTSLTGPWTPWKGFQVGALRGTPIRAPKSPAFSGGGESENDSGSG